MCNLEWDSSKHSQLINLCSLSEDNGKIPFGFNGKKKEFVLHSSENPALVLSLLPLAIYIYAKICWLISVRVMYKQSRAKLAVRPIKVSQTLGKKKKNRNLSSFPNILLKTPTDTVSKEVKCYQEGDVYTVVFLYLVHASEICIPKWSPPA